MPGPHRQLRCSAEIHQALKIICAMRGEQLTEYVERELRAALKRERRRVEVDEAIAAIDRALETGD
ncbi:MAG: hypothetical protein RL885_25185 [Planctomycetota bacterium]